MTTTVTAGTTGAGRLPHRPAPSRALAWLVAGAVATAVGGLSWASGSSTGPAGAPIVEAVTSEVPATPMDQGRGLASNSPMLQVDPTQPRFVVLANRHDAPDFGCALQVSGDGGRSWVGATPVAALPDGVEKCYAPEVAFDRQGRLYYLFVGLAGTGNQPTGAFLTTSDDRGQTFSAPLRVLGPHRFGIRMAVHLDGPFADRLQLAWLEAREAPLLGGLASPPNPIMAAFSDDGGQTLSAPVQVSRDNELAVAPALVLGSDGGAHIGYYDLGRDLLDYQGLEGPVWEEKWLLRLATSTDGGATFPEAHLIDDAVVPTERVMLVFTMAPAALVATAGGGLCAAWTDGRFGDADALLRCSDDGGRRWAPVVRLNDDKPGSGRSQYMPRLSAGPGGRVDAVFYDRRNDAANALTEVYFTSSIGGRPAAPNRKLSADPFDSRIGQQYIHPSAAGLVEFGSRLALASTGPGVLAGWTDTRNSRLFRGSTGQDVFVTTVVLAPTRDGRPPWLAVALAGAGVLAFALGLARLRSRSRPSSEQEVSP